MGVVLERESAIDSETLSEVRARLSGSVLTLADPGYEEARTIWNAMIEAQPAIIALPESETDVAELVRFAVREHLPLAVRGGSVESIVREHWQRFGRNVYSRHDYEGVDAAVARQIVADLRTALPTLAGRTAAGLKVLRADDFAYTDPVDGSVSRGQGLCVFFDEGSRLVLRASGTGTEGATLRLYLERFEPDTARQAVETQAALQPLIDAAEALTGLRARSGRQRPTVIT